MDFPRPVLHCLGPFASELHIQSPGHERREAPLYSPCHFHHRPQRRRREQLKCAKLLSSHEKPSNHVTELIQCIISITMEQVFKSTKEFKKEVFEKVQLELNQFELLIYNVNVKQLVDVRGHEYFFYLRQKTQMEIANKAKVNVAEAKMKLPVLRSRRDRYSRMRPRSMPRRRSY